MIQIMKRYITLAVIAILFQAGAFAQQDNLPSRSMTIEGNYNPSMTNAEKILPVPAKQKNVKEQAVVNYLTDPNPFKQSKRAPMMAFSEKSDNIEADSLYGIVKFGYGIRNLHDGMLDMGWLMSSRDAVRLSGLMGAWASEITDGWKSRMFDGDLTADYRHRFDAMNLKVALSYGHSHYNFREGTKMTDAIRAASNLMLETNRFKGSLALSGKISDISLQGSAGVEWLSRDGLKVNGKERNNRETLARVNAVATIPLGFGTAGLEYRQKTALYDWTSLTDKEYKNYTTFTLSPYWNITSGEMQASLGANIDIRTGSGKPFLASPMLRFAYSIKRFTLHAAITGGLEEYDIRALDRISPYWADDEMIKDGYTLYNAGAGVSFSSGTWFNIDLMAGFRHTIDEAFQMTWDNNIFVSSLIRQQTVDVFYGHMDMDMQFSDRTLVRMDITYNNYLNRFRDGKMELKPALDANVYGKFNLARGLDAMLSYRLMLFNSLNGKAMPAVNDLSLTVNYDLTRNISLYAEGRHLMGGDFYYYAGYRTLKPAVMLGATLRF